MRNTNSTRRTQFARLSLTLGVSLSLAACSGVRINSDYDPQASFDHSGRYDWADSTDILGSGTAGQPFLERRVIRAVDHAMSERGFAQDTLGEVDFIVSAFVMEPAPAEFGGVSSGGPAVAVSFGVGFGHGWAPGFGHPWGWYSYPFAMHPWAFGPWPSYSVGLGYTWLPQQGFFEGAPPGTLVVDVFDGATGELIWRGWAERALAEAAYKDDVQEFLNQTAVKILEGFPPETQSRSP